MKWSELESAFESHKISSLNFRFNLIIDISASTTITYASFGFWGIWGEWLFIFRELGSTGNYFRGAREQAHNFGDLGSLAKK